MHARTHARTHTHTTHTTHTTYTHICFDCHSNYSISLLLLGAYPRQDVAAQMSLRNCCRSSATLLAAVIVSNVSVMSFSHLCLGFPLLLFPATIPCIIVFSKPLCRVTWPKYLSFCRLTKLYIQFVGR